MATRGRRGLAVMIVLVACVSAALAAVALVRQPPEPRAALPASVPTCSEEIRLDDRLVPSCGALWGAAASAYEPERGPAGLLPFEELSGRTMGVYHAYYGRRSSPDTNPHLFPTAQDLPLLTNPERPRLLFANWKVADGMTWRDVADGLADSRIDDLSRHVERTYPYPFLLTLHHEPDNDVNWDPAAGMTPSDYADMFRHTVERLRANGLDQVVMVWNTTGYHKTVSQSWFEDLYPGDDVVDWIAWDPYVQSDTGTDQTLDGLVNRTSPGVDLPDGKPYPGTYAYFARRFPHKPLMLAEFGYQHTRDAEGNLVDVPDEGPGSRAQFYDNISRELHRFPRLKALVYFDTTVGDGPTHPDETEASLEAWRRLNTDPRLVGPPPLTRDSASSAAEH